MPRLRGTLVRLQLSNTRDEMFASAPLGKRGAATVAAAAAAATDKSCLLSSLERTCRV